MHVAFEAIWEQGQVIPVETVHLPNHIRLLVVVLDKPAAQTPKEDWQMLKGAYKGKLSTVDEFIRRKQEEKRLER